MIDAQVNTALRRPLSAYQGRFSYLTMDAPNVRRGRDRMMTKGVLCLPCSHVLSKLHPDRSLGELFPPA
jgi:hypothetical protein